jgi:hypothetical protein
LYVLGLRHDEVGQAMLLNLLLRNYLEYATPRTRPPHHAPSLRLAFAHSCAVAAAGRNRFGIESAFASE